MENDFNAVTAAQEPVVEAQGTPEASEAVSETAETGEVAVPETEAPKIQTPEENRAFKERRLKLETELEKTQREFAQLQAANDGYKQLMNSLGYEGATDDEIIVAARATIENSTPDEVRRKMSNEQERLKRLIETDPDVRREREELEALRQRDNERQFAQDLSEIKTTYPDEKAASVFDLGEDFLRLCAGGVAPIVAYEAVRAQKKRSSKLAPSTGDIKAAPKPEGEFFTKEQVESMTPEQVKANYDKIRKSMEKW